METIPTSWARVLFVNVTPDLISIPSFFLSVRTKPTQEMMVTMSPNLHDQTWSTEPPFLRYLPFFASLTLAGFRVRVATLGFKFDTNDNCPLTHTISSTRKNQYRAQTRHCKVHTSMRIRSRISGLALNYKDR